MSATVGSEDCRKPLIHHDYSEGDNTYEDTKNGAKNIRNVALVTHYRPFKSLGRLFRLLRVGFPLLWDYFFLIVFLAGCFLQQYAYSKTGEVIGEFYECIIERSRPKFWRIVCKASILFTVVSLLDSLILFGTETLSLLARKNITFKAHSLYMSNKNYYAMNMKSGGGSGVDLDNPDQRITSDVDQFTEILGTILGSTIIIPFTIMYYMVIVYLDLGFTSLWFLLLVFLIGSAVNQGMLFVVSPMVYRQDRFEGDFRFRHTDVRKHSEEIAFLSGESVEWMSLNSRLRCVLRNKLNLIWAHLPLNMWMKLFGYAGSVLNYVAVALPVIFGIGASSFSGIEEPGELTKKVTACSFACMQLIFNFTSLIQQAKNMTVLVGSTNRVGQLFEALSTTSRPFGGREDIPTPLETVFTSEDGVGEPGAIIFQDFCVVIGDDYLVKNLNAVVPRCSNLLILGKSGSGKTSMLRSICGLWPSYGEVSLPDSVVYLPQQSYIFPGTLRQQICYPEFGTAHDSDEQHVLESILRLLDLDTLLKRYEGNFDKCNEDIVNTMSVGERQRVCLARVLYASPELAVLDESTASIPDNIENIFYGECFKRGIQVISTGHRSSLGAHHDMILHLGKEGGGWELCVSSG